MTSAAPRVELVFCGTGEAFDPERGNNSLWVRGSRQVLVDCGFAAVERVWRAGMRPNDLDVLYLTHQHADHTFGLPALLLWMRLGGRTRPLVVAGGPGTSRWAGALIDLGYPGSLAPPKCFPVEFCELEPGEPTVVSGVGLTCAPSDHSVPNHAVRIEMDGAVVCASGDGAPTAQSTALFQGADALVHECYWAAGEPREGHGTFDVVTGVARRAEVGCLFLVHIGLGEREAVARACRRHRPPPQLHVPGPGERVVL